MKRRTFILGTSTLGAAAVLAACSSGSSGDSATTTTEVPAADYEAATYDEIKNGGTYNVALQELGEQQNPFHGNASGYATDVWYWYNPQFALYSPEGEWSFNPDYFTDVTAEEVDSNTVVTYTIRDEATWNDGTAID
ncbi:twin-arginine translocation signal domain-containing protein [Actinomyces howellii]|uniref:Oligopeptide-binding protein AppA n=1 Tax=Actinomyces howellii TaxID=52771 RepID=A0A3S4RC68_9ACTO|nr:twin-arginine translocation signal domain-containing protein [Actinomyces howellii]VEG29792.1 Uncharacterised protein [Actinomyces howellii]